MKKQIKNIRPLSEKELQTCLHRGAVLYSQYADSELLFLYRSKKSKPYECYEAYYGKNNFMHLAGIKSKTYSAIEFYEACLRGTITKNDCTPRHDASNMYSKVAILESLLDLQHSKCYKIGEKNLITQYNDFEMATGNENGVIGYDSRNIKSLPVPTTLLTSPITSYCAHPNKILFILQKQPLELYYTSIFYEIRDGLCREEYKNFSPYIQSNMSNLVSK